MNEKLAIPPTTGGEQFRLKFDKNGSSLIVYTSTALHNINLGLKPELQQRVTEHTSKLSSAIKPIWKGSAAEYSKSLDDDDDTTWFERQTTIAMTEQNKKVSKLARTLWCLTAIIRKGSDISRYRRLIRNDPTLWG